MKLPIQSSAQLGFTDAYILTAAAITALGTGNQVTIGVIPPGGVVTRAGIIRIDAHAGTSTDLVLDVGTTEADPDEMINALDLDALTKAAFNTGDVLVNSAAGYVINNTASDVPVLAEVNFTGTVTGGKYVIGLEILDLFELAKI